MTSCCHSKRLDTPAWDKQLHGWSHLVCWVSPLRPTTPTHKSMPTSALVWLFPAMAKAWGQIILPQPGMKYSLLHSTNGITTHYPFIMSRVLTWPSSLRNYVWHVHRRLDFTWDHSCSQVQGTGPTALNLLPTSKTHFFPHVFLHREMVPRILYDRGVFKCTFLFYHYIALQ